MRPPRRSKFALYLRSFLEKPTSPVNDTSLAKPSGKKLHQKKNSKLRSPSNARPPSDADARSAGNDKNVEKNCNPERHVLTPATKRHAAPTCAKKTQKLLLFLVATELTREVREEFGWRRKRRRVSCASYGHCGSDL